MSGTQVDKSEQRVREMFGDISPRYDFLNHFLSGGTDYYWRWRTVRAAAPAGDAPLLDVCTGTGDLAIAYARKSHGPVIGADFTHEMLTRARVKSRGEIAFIEADAQRLPFADGLFQIVSVAFGLRNVTNTQRGLDEMTRVCMPGGRVVVLEFSMPTLPVLSGLYRWYFKHVLPRLGQLISGSRDSAYQYLPDSVAQFPSGARLATMMEQSGLSKVIWKPLTFGVATLYIGTK